jgi:hypothetical protein
MGRTGTATTGNAVRQARFRARRAARGQAVAAEREALREEVARLRAQVAYWEADAADWEANYTQAVREVLRLKGELVRVQAQR